MSNQVEKSLREMYELGVEHGRKLAQKDIEIEQLQKEVNELAFAKMPPLTMKESDNDERVIAEHED